MDFLKQSLVGVAIVLALAGLNGLVNPNLPEWCMDELREGEVRLNHALVQNHNVLWVDARGEEAYHIAHAEGAVLLNPARWDELLPVFLDIWQPELMVVVYCSTRTCQASHEVAERLRSEVGIDSVFVLKGGWKAWAQFQGE